MTAPATLGDLVTRAAERNPDRGFTFLAKHAEQRLPYGELDPAARGLAAALAEYAAPGSRAVMIYPPGAAFVAAFFAVARAGLVAVPVYPPNGPLPDWLQRLESVLADADPALVLTTQDLLDLKAAAGLEIGPSRVQWLATDRLGGIGDTNWRAPRVSGNDAALLQYTSGSTGHPRGVVLHHTNLIANQYAISRAFDFRPDDVVVSWLPVYHDMGLIGCVLQPLFQATDVCLLPPLEFLARPLSWLEAVSRHGGTVGGGPNFAYELCAKHAGKLAAGSLDLSAWRLAFTGAEPVRAQTLTRFAAAFAPFGFRREAFYPCYGLAEASLIVTGADINDRPRLVAMDSAALAAGRAGAVPAGAVPAGAVPAGTARAVAVAGQDAGAGSTAAGHVGVGEAGPGDDSGPGTVTLVSVGRPVIDGEVIIADPECLRRLPDRQIGEIWVRGTSVAAGYWRNEEATRSVFRARLTDGDTGAPQPDWLRTGDLGFLIDGELVVTGRIKEVMIIRGRKVHPADVEDAAQEADARLRRGCGAAFLDTGHGDDSVTIVQETRADGTVAASELLPAVRRSVAKRLNVPLAAVVLVAPHTVPKTSSGKLRRLACRDLYLSGSLQPLAIWRRPRAAP